MHYGGGGSAGDALSGCWSREFFRIDFTLWKRHAPVSSARSAAASILAAEYCSASSPDAASLPGSSRIVAQCSVRSAQPSAPCAKVSTPDVLDGSLADALSRLATDLVLDQGDAKPH